MVDDRARRPRDRAGRGGGRRRGRRPRRRRHLQRDRKRASAGRPDGCPARPGRRRCFARQLGFPNDAVTAASELAAAIRPGSHPAARAGARRHAPVHFRGRAGARCRGDRDRRPRPARAARGTSVPATCACWRPRSACCAAEGFALHERMTLTTAGGDAHRCSYIAVANQHPYTFLGPLPVRAAPRADFEHGLDVVFTRELRSRDLWRLPVYGLIWPRHAGHGSRRVGYLHDLRAVHRRVRRADRLPARRRVRRATSSGSSSRTGRMRSGCSCRRR